MYSSDCSLPGADRAKGGEPCTQLAYVTAGSPIPHAKGKHMALTGQHFMHVPSQHPGEVQQGSYPHQYETF